MLPTLPGRIQSRLFFLATVGSIVTLVVVPFLPADGASLAEKYRTGFIVLATVAVVGIVWECLYHLLMQWRWEKDWPTLFGLVTLFPEAIVVFLLVDNGIVPGVEGPVNRTFFVVQFVLVWLAVWVVTNGPFRVLSVHWRFRGGRLV